ncbi:MAG: 2-oxoglutarate dehydrogenase complex dihydrolipoyllysine-residue succinyltransferase, partial [Gemmatimonadales bacterium]
MPVEINIPSPGESITEVIVGPWHRKAGEWVEKDQIIVEIESDKVTLEIPAPESGVLSVAAEEGAALNVGDVVGSIDPDAARPEPTAVAAESATASADAAPHAAAPSVTPAATTHATPTTPAMADNGDKRTTPVARKLAADRGVDLAGVAGTGPSGRITKSDVLAASHAAQTPTSSTAAPAAAPAPTAAPSGRPVRRERLSKLRQRIAERLVAAQHAAAMLTTFNEADMTAIMQLRKQHKEAFKERHGVGLGFMSFFVKACCSALQRFERVNAYIDGDEVEYHDYVDVSIAVGTDKGLVVPVIRDAQNLSFAGVEQTIADLATRARAGKLTLAEMTGGTFTISNGGVYGSMMSTPILNPPQSGILGMHRIQNRPVEDPANPGQIALRPMMYLALSYDHR